jgi:hypothetical protein
VKFPRFPVSKQMFHTVPHHSQLRKERRIRVAWRWCFSSSVNPRYDFGGWMARLAGPCSGWVEQVVSLWECSTLLITSRGNVYNQTNYRKQEEILLVWKDRRVHGREHGKNRQQIRTEYFSNAWWRDGITQRSRPSSIKLLNRWEVESVTYICQAIEDDGKVLVRCNPVGSMTGVDKCLDWPDLPLVELIK